MEKIILYYRNVLGIDLENLKHPVSAKINSAFSQEGLEQKVTLHHLMTLALSLYDIKDYDKSIYDFYLRKIVNNADTGVLGFIFEINQCAQLINISKNENLTFVFGDHNKKEPDFIIDDCGFEITSSRFADASNKLTPGQKLLGVFRDKNKKEYAKNDCALVIEMSHISYHALVNKEIDMTFNDVKKIIEQDSKFGVVVCIVEWTEYIENNILFKGTAYLAYSQNCSPKLKDIIENKIIKGGINEFDSKPSINPF